MVLHKDKKELVKSYRANILKLEKEMHNLPGAMVGDCCPLTHTFGDGCYVREIFLPAGMVHITKIHKKDHPYFILKGHVAVATEEGYVEIKAPFHGITKAGTKRLIYVCTDTVWVTVHVTKSKDIKEIEDEVIAKTFDDLQKEGSDVDKINQSLLTEKVQE